MSKAQSWILLIAVIAILAGAAYLAVQSINKPLESIASLSDKAATQIAEITKPTPTFYPDPITIVYAVRSLSRLETVQYSVEKIIRAESGQGTWGFLFGDSLLLVAHGTVIAGVDLGKLKTGDVRLGTDGLIEITLPAAEVFVYTLDNSKTYVYDRDKGPLAPSLTTLETAARKEAEKEILNAAIADGILVTAYRNAEAYLERFLVSLGFRQIRFTQATPIPATSQP